MVCFLLNILLQIKNVGLYYCYCGREKWQFCIICMIFFQFEKDIYNNMFDADFLFCYYDKVVFQLKRLFQEKKGVVCCFLHDEYSYLIHDIDTSENRFFTVSEIIKMVETVQIDRMINLGIVPPSELLKEILLQLLEKNDYELPTPYLQYGRFFV